MRRLLSLILQSSIPAPWDVWSAYAALLPFLSAAVAGGLGWMQGVPLMYIYVGAILAFAGTGVGLLRVLELRVRISPANKLAFSRSRVAVGRTAETMQPLRLGFELHSCYDYPLDCEIVSVTSRVGDRIPLEEPQLPQIIDVPPNGVVWFDDHIINAAKPQDGSVVEGTLEFEVAYGPKGGKRKHYIRSKKRVYVAFDDDGNVRGMEWQDAL